MGYWDFPYYLSLPVHREKELAVVLVVARIGVAVDIAAAVVVAATDGDADDTVLSLLQCCHIDW